MWVFELPKKRVQNPSCCGLIPVDWLGSGVTEKIQLQKDFGLMNFETLPSSTLSSGHWLSGDLIIKIGIMEIQQPNVPSAFVQHKKTLDLEI